MAPTAPVTNPLLEDWSKNSVYGLPPFDRISAEHFKPAFEVAFKEHKNDVRAIAQNPEVPTFENTIASLDRAGDLVDNVGSAFSTLCSSRSSKELQAVQRDMAGPLSDHYSSIKMEPGLFARIDSLQKQKEAGTLPGPVLTAEQSRLLDRFHLDFIRAGAKFGESEQSRYAAILKVLAEKTTAFQQNIVADEAEWILELNDNDQDLAGLPDFLRDSARAAAKERAAPDGKVVISLSRSLVEPFLTFSARRDLREKAWRAWTTRGELDPKRDNLRIAREILSLRKAQSGMHGYPDFSQFKTADSMAGTPTAVSDLLLRVWEPAKKSAARERQALEDFLTETGGGVESLPDGLQPWDWRFYAEQVRVNKYALDEAEIKPYFSLEAMTTAMFDCAERLFGLRFLPISGAKTYHPDVQVYEVRERFQKCANGQADGQDTGGTGDNTTTNEMESGRNAKREDRLVGVFFHDNYCRPFKNSGAWMSELRGQTKNRNPARNAASLPAELTVPVVTNNNNFAKGGEGEPTLLTFDDARTLFHEFGHGLHGLLSNVSYSRLAGTNVLTDFVELPSQLFEHWLSEPEVLKKHARHYRTGEAIPDDLLDKLKAAERFNQGFSTVEYTSSALLDQALHTASVPPQPEKPESIILPAHRSDEDAPEPIPLLELDISAFERDYLDKLGMPQGMVPRHRPAHFAHLFSTSMYASAYYVYMWAQVLDADAFDAFKETSIFDAATAARVRKFIYSAGNSDDPAKLYRGFRGRDPKVEPLMKKLGLMN